MDIVVSLFAVHATVNVFLVFLNTVSVRIVHEGLRVTVLFFSPTCISKLSCTFSSDLTTAEPWHILTFVQPRLEQIR